MQQKDPLHQTYNGQNANLRRIFICTNNIIYIVPYLPNLTKFYLPVVIIHSFTVFTKTRVLIISMFVNKKTQQELYAITLISRHVNKFCTRPTDQDKIQLRSFKRPIYPVQFFVKLIIKKLSTKPLLPGQQIISIQIFNIYLFYYNFFFVEIYPNSQKIRNILYNQSQNLYLSTYIKQIIQTKLEMYQNYIYVNFIFEYKYRNQSIFSFINQKNQKQLLTQHNLQKTQNVFKKILQFNYYTQVYNLQLNSYQQLY
eukprot:TRINITY_DN21203_c0_g1_i2.p2 TRINITY_DN21203_c0_g1~~TRINITY_DN21203_c0_g1_i2.p2  ORF type:complete len:271 (-),score=-26.06 TRINITY_DN21203_c0_g1_i2:425-1189(-)